MGMSDPQRYPLNLKLIINLKDKLVCLAWKKNIEIPSAPESTFIK